MALDSPLVRIGVVDGEEQYLFRRIHSVITTHSGKIVVGDQAPRVALFDMDGVWLRDLAQRGRGPGEVQLIGGMWSHSADTIAAWDPLQRKLALLRLSSDGVREIPLEWGPTARPVDGIGATLVLELETGQLMDTARAVSRLVIYSEGDSSTLVRPYKVPEIGWKQLPGGIGHMVNAPVFDTYPAWDASAAGLWWTDGSSSTLSLLDWSGQNIAEVTLLTPTRAIVEADREAYYAGQMVRYGFDERPKNGAEQPFAERAPLITRIVADDNGGVWLGNFDPGADPVRGWTGSIYTVVNGVTEQVIGQVTFPAGFTLTDVRAGFAAGVWEDSDGLHYADVYDVRALGATEESISDATAR